MAENKYQYNGKELNTELGLDLEDYGARWYNPAIGRWTSVDPAGEEGGQESWTGYHYTFGNPVSRTDPDGRMPSGNCCEGLHTTLDVVGLMPGLGEIADGLNALIYAAEGDFKNAGISSMALLPILGSAATGTRLANKAVDAAKAIDKGSDAAKAVDKVEDSNKVYRGLSETDLGTLKDGKGISAKNPNANNSAASHVAGKKDTRWISTTKDESIAKNKYGKNGYAEIDLNKVKSDKVDISKGFSGQPKSRITNYAKKDKEVLIEKEIPQNAIIIK